MLFLAILGVCFLLYLGHRRRKNGAGPTAVTKSGRGYARAPRRPWG